MVFRVFFITAIYFNLDINYMDMKIVFLYGFIDQFIYVQILKGLKSSTNKRMVYKLLKTLYGFKQASKLWYKVFSNSSSKS